MQIPKDNLNDATAVQKTTNQLHGTSSGQSTTHDAKVDALRQKRTLFHLQDEAEMDVLEEVLRDFSWSRNSTDYTVKMIVQPKKTEWTQKTSSDHTRTTWRLQGQDGLQQRRSKEPASQQGPTTNVDRVQFQWKLHPQTARNQQLEEMKGDN